MARISRIGLWLMPLLALGLLASACGGGGGTATPTPAGKKPPPSPGAGLTALPSAAAFRGARIPVERRAVSTGVALLEDVRTGQHEGFDRIVFEFQGGIPSYRVEYVEPPILEDASGLPVEIEGEAFLRVRFQGAAGHDPSSGEPTYQGPQEIAVGLPTLLEAQRTGDFEGTLTWVLGLAREVDFRVSNLQDPFRVVVDVAHP